MSIDAALLDEARSRHVQLSPLLENAIRERLRQEQQKEWLEENREAIRGYNEQVHAQGTFSDGLRSF